MKKDNKEELPDDSGVKLKHPVTAEKKSKEGSAEVSFPQEFEEQLSMGIRMKPQPLVKRKKSES